LIYHQQLSSAWSQRGFFFRITQRRSTVHSGKINIGISRKSSPKPNYDCFAGSSSPNVAPQALGGIIGGVLFIAAVASIVYAIKMRKRAILEMNEQDENKRSVI